MSEEFNFRVTSAVKLEPRLNFRSECWSSKLWIFRHHTSMLITSGVVDQNPECLGAQRSPCENVSF